MRGGKRPGAGRKSNKEIQAIRDLFDQAFTSSDWCDLAGALMKSAKKGNMRAAELLLRYRFGDSRGLPSHQLSPEQWLAELLKEAGKDVLGPD